MSPIALFVAAVLERGWLVEFQPAYRGRVRCTVKRHPDSVESYDGHDPDEAAKGVAGLLLAGQIDGSDKRGHQ